MGDKSRIPAIFVFLAVAIILVSSPAATDFGIGFLEGGSYSAHSEFRDHFRQQLEAMVPAGYNLVFFPDGFQSAEWKREKSRAMAQALARNPRLDLIVAIGPWAVEDLLAAGCEHSIVAVYRFDPAVDQLLDSLGRPIVDNLTVRVRPQKIVSDLQYLTSLAPIRKLGLLQFVSDSNSTAAAEKIRQLGERVGFEVITAEAYDRNGTFAFFKAYQSLRGKIDALYLNPLWGFDSEKMRQFYAMIARDHIPTFTSEGDYHVARGALAAGSMESPMVRAHYQAWKVIQIMQGVTPADLPVVHDDEPGLTINQLVAQQLGFDLETGRSRDVSIMEGPAPDDIERLTVIDAINLAQIQNPGYQAIYAALDAAGHAADEARSAYRPQVGLTGSAIHADRNQVNNDDRYSANQYRLGLELNQELFSLGVRRDISLSGLQRDQAEARLAQAQLDLELAVTRSFLNLIRAQQALAAEQSHRRKIRHCLQLARLRLELKEQGHAPVWRWEQEFLRAIQFERRAEADLNIASIVLNSLMGRPGDYRFVIDWVHFSDPNFFRAEAVLSQVTGTETAKNELVELLLGQAVSSNPSLSQADLGIDIGQARSDRNQASFFPTVGFRAALNLTDEWSDRPGFTEENPSWSVGATFKLPLFMGGSRIKKSHRLRSELDSLEFERDERALQISSRLRVIVEEMLARAEEFLVAARAADIANKYYPEILAEAATGASGITELLDAVHNDRQATLNAIDTQIEYYKAVTELIHTTGISASSSGRSPNEELLIQIAPLVTGGRN